MVVIHMSKPKVFKDMLQFPDRYPTDESNVPCLIIRELLATLDIGHLDWENKMQNYFASIHGDDLKKIREEKANLTGALERDVISWKRFEQALHVIAPNRVRFKVSLEFADEVEVESQVIIRTRLNRKQLRTAKEES